MAEWEPATKVQKNDAGQYRALIGDQWIPVAKAQKNSAGEYRILRTETQTKQPFLETWAQPPVRETDPLKTFGADVLTGATGLMRGGANLLSEGLGTKLFPPAEGSADSTGKLVGSLLDPAALAIGGGVAKAFPYVPMAGKGFKEGVSALWKNLMAGTTTGGAIGALSEDSNATTGSIVSGVANVALPPAISGIGKSTGAIIDVLTGRHPTVKAADILRAAAGKDVGAIKAATANAPSDLTTTQATYGINNNTWDALGELAARNDKESYFSRLSDKQKQDMVDAIRKIAGGANQTEAMATTDASMRALNAVTTPMRETELAAANTAGKLAPKFQETLDKFGTAAANKVKDVRRFTAVQDRIPQTLSASAQPVPQRYTYAGELANRAEQVATDAAEGSLRFGDAARMAKSALQSLEDNGLRPLDTKTITSSLAGKIRNPSMAGNEQAKKVLGNVADEISAWTERGGGVIDADALYAIRKNAVNSQIETMMGTADPKLKAKQAAKLLGEVKPLIDEAIIKAGGTQWRDYLRTFEMGMEKINQQKMGAKALDLLERTPKRFESLAAGNEPKMVEKIFGTEYDLAKAMGSSVKPINEVAAQIARDRIIKESAAKGEGGLAGILSENVSKFKLPNWINAKVAITNRALDALETQVNKKTMETVYQAMRTGKTANALLDEIPSSEKMKVINALVKGRTSGLLQGGVSSGVLSQSATE